MEHSEAIRLKAAERYLLGELSGDLRSQFEEHFFGCAECAEALGAGAVFIHNARELLAERAAQAPVFVPAAAEKRNWFTAFFRPAWAAPALAVLLAIVVYQSAVVIPKLRTPASDSNAPQTLANFSLLAQNSRGAEPLKIIARPDRPFGLFVDIPPQQRFAAYDCRFHDTAGKPELAIKVSADEARQTVELLVPPSRLQSGEQTLVVSGLESSEDASGTEVARYPFTLEYSK